MTTTSCCVTPTLSLNSCFGDNIKDKIGDLDKIKQGVVRLKGKRKRRGG